MSPLTDILKARIAADGPISLHDYMTLALSHPLHGYYTAAEPFGPEGDFLTAPEAGQMFGELIGLWAIDVWMKLGSPETFLLIEMGPGNGTLMGDALRSARLMPEFLKAADIRLIEMSPRLQKKQATLLAGYDVKWQESLADLPEAPIILIANEFFDALPIHQYVRTGTKWRERCVTHDGTDFKFTLSLDSVDVGPAPDGAEGDILESCPMGEALIAEISDRLHISRGAALIIDYGPAEKIMGDSFQAVRKHRHAAPLSRPGEQDLTAHVKFATLKRIAEAHGIEVHGPTPQGLFLERLGIEARHHLLRQKADEAQRKALDAQLRRLTSAEEMGTLFKAMALAHNMPTSPEGFGN
tara:strand:+ start:302 stop:1366 length:1065 start_codon:yes stop_codon:yes gene_type:complete